MARAPRLLVVEVEVGESPLVLAAAEAARKELAQQVVEVVGATAPRLLAAAEVPREGFTMPVIADGAVQALWLLVED